MQRRRSARRMPCNLGRQAICAVAMRARRRWASGSRMRMRVRTVCASSSRVCSTSSGRVSPAPTAWCCRGLSRKRGTGSRSRSTAMVARRVALRTFVKWPTRCCFSSRRSGLTFNVGSDREVRVLELAQLVKRATGSASPIVLVPHANVFPEGFVDPQRRVPCLDRLRACIGFAPSTSIEAIVDELCAVPASEAVQRALAARAMA